MKSSVTATFKQKTIMKPEQKHKGHPHAELMKLYAEDAMESETPWENWECRSKCGTWNNLLNHPSWVEDIIYRRKPRFIEINGHQVPEPVRLFSEIETGSYFVVGVTHPELYYKSTWMECYANRCRLKYGLIHLTKEAAIAHAKALLSFTAKEVAK